MTSKERVIAALNHRQPDRVPMDIGASGVSGIHASVLSRVKAKLGLKGTVRVCSPIFMLGEIEEDVRSALQIDVIQLAGGTNNMGLRQENFEPFTLFDGTEVLVAGGMKLSTGKDGSLYFHPGCDLSLPPSARMPHNGFYFDAVDRQEDLDEDNLDAARDYGAEYSVYKDEELETLRKRAQYIMKDTQCGALGHFSQGSLGDFGKLPGINMKIVKGIRRPEDWLAAHIIHPEYVKERYEIQTETALKNLELYKQAVGDAVQAIIISSADFGTQRCEIMSPDMYREFYKPYHKRLNAWVHANTDWKVFFHTCGAVSNIIADLIDAGVDILNPVQCSASGMDPKMLKEKYGDKLVFWGGGCETQNTLQLGSAEDVYNEVMHRLEIFAPGGGYVLNPVHNIQPLTPPENVLAFVQARKDYDAIVN